MARVGPNQDINDPSTLEALRILATNVSLLAKENFEEFGGEPLTGGLAIPITLELKLDNGSSVFISNHQPALWERAVINTYINQPERFRAYWNSLNEYAQTIAHDEIETEYSFDIGAPDCTITYNTTYEQGPGPFFWTRRSNIKTCSFPVSMEISGVSVSGTDYPPLNQPVWSGVGPTLYNYNTFPQLENEFNAINTRLLDMDESETQLSSGVGNFGYRETTFYNEYDTPSPSFPSIMGVTQRLDTGIDSPYLTIYNPTTEDIALDLTYSLRVIPGSPGISHQGFKQIAVGSNQAYKSTAEGDPYSEVDSLGGTFSDSTTINIPSKTSKGITFPILFDSSVFATWDHEDDRIPENSLGAFLCTLELTMTIEGISDDIQFIPVVSI